MSGRCRCGGECGECWCAVDGNGKTVVNHELKKMIKKLEFFERHSSKYMKMRASSMRDRLHKRYTELEG